MLNEIILPTNFLINSLSVLISMLQLLFLCGRFANNYIDLLNRITTHCTLPGGPISFPIIVHSGHKQFHCIAYLTITIPDGLVLYLLESVEGRQPDSVVHSRSDLDDHVQLHLLIDEMRYYFYSDTQFLHRPWLRTAYQRVNASTKEVDLNR